jgi:hypothetical protein
VVDLATTDQDRVFNAQTAARGNLRSLALGALAQAASDRRRHQLKHIELKS